ncbi:MAG: DUF1893 domain-containing protein [Rikenellaceae bacterium]
MLISELKEILHNEGCSCVVYNGVEPRLFYRRGVADLYDLLRSEPGSLCGAMVADKVIGTAAAAIIVTGEVRELYTKAISHKALRLIEESNIKVSYDELIEYVINRAGDGMCPLERACRETNTAEEAMTIVDNWD